MHKYAGVGVFPFFPLLLIGFLSVCITQRLSLGAWDDSIVAQGRSVDFGDQKDLVWVPGSTTYSLGDPSFLICYMGTKPPIRPLTSNCSEH